jgi:hypothetical protein
LTGRLLRFDVEIATFEVCLKLSLSLSLSYTLSQFDSHTWKQVFPGNLPCQPSFVVVVVVVWRNQRVFAGFHDTLLNGASMAATQKNDSRQNSARRIVTQQNDMQKNEKQNNNAQRMTQKNDSQRNDAHQNKLNNDTEQNEIQNNGNEQNDTLNTDTVFRRMSV